MTIKIINYYNFNTSVIVKVMNENWIMKWAESDWEKVVLPAKSNTVHALHAGQDFETALATFESLNAKHILSPQEFSLYLQEEYWISVQLIEWDADIGKQVAEWKNWLLVMDVRNRGSLGSVFMLSHIFGHYAQFCSGADYSHIWNTFREAGWKPPYVFPPGFRQTYFQYEHEAFQIWKTVLWKVMEMGEEEEVFLRSFMHVDFDNYWSHLTTGKSLSRDKFNTAWVQDTTNRTWPFIGRANIPEWISRELIEKFKISVV